MSFWFEYLENEIDPQLIRELAKLSDEAVKLSIATLICSIAGGMKELPTKAPKIAYAKRLLEKGIERKRIIRLTGISEATYYRLKRAKNG